jgi:hypothetical protein
MKKTLFALMAIITLVFADSCKKYEEGPSLSLRSRKARVANSWKVEQYLLNGSDQTSSINVLLPNYREVYDKEGNYSFSYDNQSGSGKWSFQNDDMEIKRNGVSNQSSETLIILKLKEKEFWYKIVDGSDTEEVHLIPAN